MAILLIRDYVNFNEILMYNTSSDWIESFFETEKSESLEVNSLSLEEKYASSKKYNIGRIDLFNKDKSNNSIDILGISDNSAEVLFPKWLKKSDGTGVLYKVKNFH